MAVTKSLSNYATLTQIANKADLDSTTGLVRTSQLPPITQEQQRGSFLEFGGAVSYLSTAYDFRVSPATYTIQGTRYTSELTDVSLSAADATFDRFDVIIVDTTGTVSVVAGTPAANPSTPDIDPLSQLILSTILVAANSTVPEITNTPIYRENADWTSSVSGNIVANSTTDPFAGTYCVAGTSAAATAYVRFTTGTAISLVDQKQLVFMLKPTSSWPSQKSLRITWYSGGVKIGQSVAVSNGRYNFITAQQTYYQQIVIPITDFQVPASQVVDRLEFYVLGSSSAISFRLDNVVLEPTSTIINPTVATLEGSQITGPYSTAGMTLTGPDKLLGRITSGTGPAEEIDVADIVPTTDPLVTDIADFIPAATTNLTYSSGGDTNGVFYFIGTQYGTLSWTNPITAGYVLGLSKYGFNGANTSENLVNRTGPENVYTGDFAGGYIAFDLGQGNSLILNKYTLTTWTQDAGYIPKNWKIQGSNSNIASWDSASLDAATWVDLDVRSNDTAFTGTSETKVFTVTGVSTGYRYIRLLAVNPFNSNATNYIVLQEFEFYGTFDYTPSPAAAGPLVFTGGISGEIKTKGTNVSTTTGNQDNLDLVLYENLVCNNATTTTIRGIAAGVYNGERKRIISIGAGSVVVAHQNANSTAANRIITSTGADITLTAGTDRIDLIYDTTNSRWRAWLVSTNSSDISYDNTTSQIASSNVQDAIDELAADIGANVLDSSLESIKNLQGIVSTARTFASVNDTNGVIYFIGTNRGTESFSNPANTRVTVASNTTEAITSLTDRDVATDTATNNTNGNFFAIDLGENYSLVVNSYTLRNRYLFEEEHPRNWKLQGSNDVNTAGGPFSSDFAAATWVDLDTQTNQTGQTGSNQTYRYTVSGQTTAYRFLRILTTGLNSGGSTYTLRLSEFEFYGTLYYPETGDSGPLEISGDTGNITVSATTVSTTTGTQNNLSLSGIGVAVLNNATATTITGIVAGYNGQRLSIVSIGAGSVTISHQSGSSTAANRIITSTGSDITLAAGTGRAELVYDTTNSRWRAWSVPTSTGADILELQVFN